MADREARRVVVAGASGFVGRALVAALVSAGHDVTALARHPIETAGSRAHAVDVGDERALAGALIGVDVAYYLVHSMAGGGFRTRDRVLAEHFGAAAAAAGVSRVIYLGGLGDEPSSEHLASRHEVGVALAAAGVPVVELRAAVVLGSGSISFEMLRYLTERLPFMVCPRWVHTEIQPIALDDMVAYLLTALDVSPGVYEVGGADVTTYRDMIGEYARVRGLRRRLIVNVPYLTPRLSSYWVDLVTPVDRRVSHALIESLGTPVVVRDRARTDDAFGLTPMGLAAAIGAALEAQARTIDRDLLDRATGLLDGVYTTRSAMAVPHEQRAAVDADLNDIGASYEWYGLPLAWRARALLGRLAGERWRLRRPAEVRTGEPVDWWTITRRDPGTLVLRAVGWAPGEGWLGYRVDDHQLVQVGSLRPKGLPGFLYWKLLQPVHTQVFHALARHRVQRASLPRR